MATTENPAETRVLEGREDVSIGVERYFTSNGDDPFETVDWEQRTALIPGKDGPSFEQKDVEFPSFWSQTATNIVAQKYFRGKLNTPQREHSVRQMIGRVTDTITTWGVKDGYFVDQAEADTFHAELTHLLLHQMVAFNSPVWFNLGFEENPQASACFILSVDDSMDSILDWITKEGRVFRGGSGSGINLSKLRSSKEQLSKGGYASGPVSFMRGADASAGTIKSGGKTRRAAKMVVLNVDHPDIEEFIWCKQHEEEKARVLQAAGYDMSLDSPDWASIQYQNANNSVRVTDEFMRAVLEDEEWNLTARTDGSVVSTVRARDLMHQISEAAWKCADPGMHYDTTMNDWHTCPASGRINASNPCSEYLHVDNSACNLASLNLMKFRDPETLEFQVERFERAVDIIFMAQEILVSNSSYPTEEITRNAKAMRQLGLGYANLGALLMARGLPYDSDEGRAYAGAITAIMTGRAYRKSADMAGRIGPFDDYAKNSDAMLRVIRKHRAAVANIDAGVVPDEMMLAARKAWDEALALGEANGYRNSQATVLAPTGCLVGDNLVMSEYGLARIDDLGDPSGDKWQDIRFRVQTDEGPQQATKFYVNGVEPVVTVETGRGYQIKGTTLHRVRVVDVDGEWQWRRLADIRPGDRVPIMLGGMLDDAWTIPLPPLAEPHHNSDNTAVVPRTMTPELAELIGYFMGDGSLHAKALRFCATAADSDVVERLIDLGRSLFGIEASVTPKQGYVEVAYSSVRLVEWWEACGFAKLSPAQGHTGKGYAPHVPRAVLRTNDRDVYRAFVRGLFEADGNVSGGYVYWSSVNERFSRDVQTLMLALGYVTTRKVDEPTTKFGRRPSHVLRLLNVSTTTEFIHDVGLISERKRRLAMSGQHPQASRYDHIPVTRAMVDQLIPENDWLRKRSLMMLARKGAVTRSTAIDLLERTESEEIDHLLDYYYDTVRTVELGEEECTYDLSVPANVTYVANGFVSHNTISFMMDCDTTGVEPDFSLVKSKKLVGGGDITIVNQTVPTALSKLGYAPHEIDQIVAFVNEHNTVVGAPGFKGEHLQVFDVAVGDRAIHHMGHVKMMASVQPFISGAISKTVNLPTEVTVDDVAGLYIDAWKLGVKAIAIYRDGCKVAQPLSTKSDAPELIVAKPQRRVMPIERQEIGRKFKVGEYEGYIHVGLFPEGDPGDVFVDIAKEGTTLAGLMNAFMIAVSVGIQYGVPLEVFVSKFAHMRFEPSGLTNDPDIRVAKSIPDYIFRWMGKRFLDTDQQADLGIMSQAVRDRIAASYDAQEAGEPAAEIAHSPSAGQAALFNAWEDAVECAKCGGRKVRTGACYTCRDCGDNSGCG